MGVCTSMAACLCFLVCLCLLCFEANKYDDDDDARIAKCCARTVIKQSSDQQHTKPTFYGRYTGQPALANIPS